MPPIALLAQRVDGQALEEQRESRPRYGPWYPNLHHAMLAADHAGNSRMQVCLELAAIEMPPRPFRGVVIERQRLPPVRTHPRRVICMLGPDVHPLSVDVQVHVAHGPGRLQAQQVLIECGVVHGRSLPG